MKEYIEPAAWSIIERGFKEEYNLISESLFSLGNGYMGMRGNFEEDYSGETLQGSYIAGVYYPDKTKVGWWKNGYPEYFAKVLNACNWIGIRVSVDGEILDMNTCIVTEYICELDMKQGVLHRSSEVEFKSGKKIKIESRRFVSMVTRELSYQEYTITALNFSGEVIVEPYLDFDVYNQDTNYDEQFWTPEGVNIDEHYSYISASTKKTKFLVTCGMQNEWITSNSDSTSSNKAAKEKYVSETIVWSCAAGESFTLSKKCAIVHNANHLEDELQDACENVLDGATSFKEELSKHAAWWSEKWSTCDIEINGDVKAQQGIRFNIFQLYQTYTGDDPRLNIGPKGFTGEKYGGSTYWDTEAYCLPFYMGTASDDVARNLLIYRHQQLDKAIENAGKLGFNSGAALYPMVTMNGEECHNEWEITFEEIHRNGAMIFAIYYYALYSGDEKYMSEYGVDVLVGVARFWAQRAHYSHHKNKYVINGVTGPNEYENNINNNWYTNYIAAWCLRYAADTVEELKSTDSSLLYSLNITDAEIAQWRKVDQEMFYPVDEELGIFLQQEDYLDKEQVLVKDLKESDMPICQNWSWDRILRSPFIKQADVLQGIYFFEDQFTTEEIQRNFRYYEPRTVHESSLSPCIHNILAARIGDYDKAYEMYLRTARLDLDDYNNDTEDGCHITSMAGTWLSVVQGFGGMRIEKDKVSFAPHLPAQWDGYTFNVKYRGHTLGIRVERSGVEVSNTSSEALILKIYDQEVIINSNGTASVPLKESFVLA